MITYIHSEIGQKDLAFVVIALHIKVAIERTIAMLAFYCVTLLGLLSVGKTISTTSRAYIKSTKKVSNRVPCYAFSTNNDMMECATGDFGTKWRGCIDQGSVRVRCPKGTMPCNDFSANGKEVSCWNNCSRHGGLKACLKEGRCFFNKKKSFNSILKNVS